MYKGKFSKKNNRRLAPWAALALALVLALSVGGTVAYLFTNTGSVVNTFTPGKTDITITEDLDKEEPKKNNIVVNTTGNVPVYVRVMLVATYQDENGQVCGQHGTVTVPEFKLNTPYWVKGDDNFYYYTTTVIGSTESLIKEGSSIELDQAEDGCVMHVEVLAQSIQAEPADAVKDAWGVDPTTLGSN